MWIGNHSYTHPHLTQDSQSQIVSEISRTQQATAGAGGGTPKLFRPPFGDTNATVRTAQAQFGLTQIIWDIDSQDWNGASVDAIVAANARLANGQIILMHEWPANTLTAIPRIAQGLASCGPCPGMISPTTAARWRRADPPVTPHPWRGGPRPPRHACGLVLSGRSTAAMVSRSRLVDADRWCDQTISVGVADKYATAAIPLMGRHRVPYTE
jgi:hypothetical protein